MPRIVKRFLLSWAALVVCATAMEDDPTAKWVAELSAVYAKSHGFIATYHFELPGKTLDVTLAADLKSGRFVGACKGEHAGESFEMRQWNNAARQMFVSTGRETQRIDGMEGATEILVAIANGVCPATELPPAGQPPDDDKKAAPVPRPPGKSKPFAAMLANPLTMLPRVPEFHLTKDSIQMGCRGHTNDPPGWADVVKGATIGKTDDETVTFATPALGDVTVSRKTGIMVRQSIAGEDGVPRVLELRSLKLDPEIAEIDKLSADWNTDKVEIIPAGVFLADSNFVFFQKLIAGAESGEIDVSKLEGSLKDQRDNLRAFAAGCLSDDHDAVSKNEAWKTLARTLKKITRDNWLKTEPGAKADDEKAFEAYIARPDVRAMVRDGAGEAADKNERFQELVVKELFDDKLEATKASGEMAKRLIQTAVTRAYIEAVMEEKIASLWSERSGLD